MPLVDVEALLGYKLRREEKKKEKKKESAKKRKVGNKLEQHFSDEDETEIFLWWRDRPEKEDNLARHDLYVCVNCGEVVLSGWGERHSCKSSSRTPFTPGRSAEEESHPMRIDNHWQQNALRAWEDSEMEE